MSIKLKDLLVRGASSILIVAIALGAIWSSYLGFGALLLVITLCSVYEFFQITKSKGYVTQPILGLVVAGAIVAFGFDFFYNGSANNISLGLFLMLVVPLIFVVELFKGGGQPIENVGTTLFPMIYVALPMSMLAGVPLLMTGGVWNPLTMILYMFLIWGNDTCAYLVGVSIGRHKLFESVSPKKSWEGFFGGIVGAVAVSLVAARILDGDVVMWVCVALITSVMGSVGDLVESMFKRSCGVKDSGDLLPGHGGCLDRFDSLIFSAPFVFVFLIIYSQL